MCIGAVRGELVRVEDGWQDASRLGLRGVLCSSQIEGWLGYQLGTLGGERIGCWARFEWTALPKDKCGPVGGRASSVHGSSFDKGGGAGRV